MGVAPDSGVTVAVDGQHAAGLKGSIVDFERVDGGQINRDAGLAEDRVEIVLVERLRWVLDAECTITIRSGLLGIQMDERGAAG